MRISKKLIIFIILLIGCNAFLNFAFHVPSYTRMAFHEVQSDINYDLICIGQSHARYAYNPYILDEMTGLNTYNLSRSLVCTRDLFYFVKESNYKNTPKILVYDLDSYYWTGYEKPNYYADGYVYPSINNPVNKIDYLFRYALKEDWRYSICRYVLYGFGGLKELPRNISYKASDEYLNYEASASLSADEYCEYRGKGYFYAEKRFDDFGVKSFTPEKWDKENVKHDAIEGYKNIVDYCKKNDILLICVVPPLPAMRLEAENYKECHDYFDDLTRNDEVVFWDYNFIDRKNLDWTDEDFRDVDGHMLGNLSEKYSALLGEMINKYNNRENTESYFREM